MGIPEPSEEGSYILRTGGLNARCGVALSPFPSPSHRCMTSHLSASAPVPQLMLSSPLLFFSMFNYLLLIIIVYYITIYYCSFSAALGCVFPTTARLSRVSFHFCSHHAAPLCSSSRGGLASEAAALQCEARLESSSFALCCLAGQ